MKQQVVGFLLNDPVIAHYTEEDCRRSIIDLLSRSEEPNRENADSRTAAQEAKAAPAPSIEPGQNKIMSNVTVVYEIR